MSARPAPRPDAESPTAVIEAASADMSLAEGQSYCVASPDNPLRRNIAVSIKATLDDLVNKSSKATWAPSSSALKSAFQQKKFTSLEGSVDAQGDLKSIVLHDLSVHHMVSSFPIALGAKITGVDDCTFSKTGEAFSMVVMPNSSVTTPTKLQSDDVSLAYEFAKKFPGYTADNLSEKGIHEVSQRRFVLVAADHPLVSAISENADKLQMGEISMMPKISQGLYDSILPLVTTQVASQIKVRDFSHCSVSIQPSDFGSWAAARAEIMAEKKRPLKAKMETAIAGAADDAEAKSLRADFEGQEAAIEAEVGHTPMELHLNLGISYNFLSR